MLKIVLATRNQGKVKEFRELLSSSHIEIVGLDKFPQVGEIEEIGATFKENAAIKAETVSKITGLPVVADDSGLEVDFLNGAPGVNSARFAGVHGNDEANNNKLLQLMDNVPLEKRTGRFVCAIAIAIPDSITHIVEGMCEGSIALETLGTGGFGYDPLFIPKDYQVTMGQMSKEEKNKISHRSKAVGKAVKVLEEHVVK